jgi:hypothetical protein
VMDSLPTEKEINVYDDLDGRTACEHFLGKTVEDAEAMFQENSLYYEDDLKWMGPIAFQYYAEAAIRYLQSDAAEHDCDFVSALAGTLEFRLEHFPESLAPISVRLVSVCEYVVANWPRFKDEYGLYGDVPSRYSALRAALSNVKAT